MEHRKATYAAGHQRLISGTPAEFTQIVILIDMHLI
jgi:hypothetical protein